MTELNLFFLPLIIEPIFKDLVQPARLATAVRGCAVCFDAVRYEAGFGITAAKRLYRICPETDDFE